MREWGGEGALRKHMKVILKNFSDPVFVDVHRRRMHQLIARLPSSPEARELNIEDARITPSPWCSSASKRGFDLLCVLPGLILLTPFLAMIAIAVRFTSPGSVIFRQQRVGRSRKLFTIYKFRTMVQNSEAMGPGYTAKDDPRITFVGSVLRRFKLDELPQLYNVLLGDMSLVGPRPKLPDHERVPMACRPGVTGAATLAFRQESRILSQVPADQIESFYQQYMAPHKLRLDCDYMERATMFSDIGVLFATVLRLGEPIHYDDLVNDKAVTLVLRQQTRCTATEEMIGTAVGKNS